MHCAYTKKTVRKPGASRLEHEVRLGGGGEGVWGRGRGGVGGVGRCGMLLQSS